MNSSAGPPSQGRGEFVRLAFNEDGIFRHYPELDEQQ